MPPADGRVVSIHVSPAAGSPMRQRGEVRAVPRRGLEGDRYFEGAGEFSSRTTPGREVTEVTLIEAEVIEHLQRDLGIDVEVADSRRNIVTRGVSLNSLVGSEFQVGQVRLLGASLCEPCVSLVKSARNKHLLRGLAHKGGLRARILTEGTIAVGDTVVERRNRSRSVWGSTTVQRNQGAAGRAAPLTGSRSEEASPSSPP